ncbi:MAG: hypothetical protein LBB94_03870 [Clostridiales bacterium]|jgi:hypothetical protein|nr:hypothetical protein [Clostridiales bacterium]
MTDKELASVVTILTLNFNRNIREVYVLWAEFFTGYDYAVFKKAARSLILDSERAQYFPTVGEMQGAYDKTLAAVKAQRLEIEKATQKAMREAQMHCVLCDGSGFVEYETGESCDGIPYTAVARCTCAHGRDLNRFSHAQINGVFKISESKSLYWPTIGEVLGKHDYSVFLTKRKLKYDSRPGVTTAMIDDIQTSLHGKIVTDIAEMDLADDI